MTEATAGRSRVPAPGTWAAPVGDEVQVWWAQVPVGTLGDPERAALAGDLDAATVARLDRFHRVEDRDRGLAAHALLRRLLAAVAGGSPSELALRKRCGGCGAVDHGKPYLDTGSMPPVVELNLSHSGEVVCVALAAPGVAVGVDVEQRRRVDWPALRRSVFNDPEWARTQASDDPDRVRTDYWARKESAVKSSGHGLSLPLPGVALHDLAGGGWTAALPSGAGWAAGRDLDLHPGVAAAVARHAHTPPQGPPPVAVRQADLTP